jgi:hypothetical protein
MTLERAPQVPYSAEEDAKLTEMYITGARPTHIAEVLGRTRGSVNSRVVKLKLKSKRKLGTDRSGFRWGDDEIDVLRKNRDAPVDVLMTLLPGRGPYGINKMLAQIGAERPPASTGRPIGVPFQTPSGVWAIRLASGVVPYVPTIHAHLHGGPLDRARISLSLS